eukprot:3577949-Rhodomonas_salina.1
MPYPDLSISESSRAALADLSLRWSVLASAQAVRWGGGGALPALHHAPRQTPDLCVSVRGLRVDQVPGTLA